MTDCNEYLNQLDSDDREVVREGAFRAGEAMCAEAVPKLAELLKVNNLGVQEAAESSLRKIGGKATVHAVLPLLRSEDPPVRNLSMDILREIGGEDLPSLMDMMTDSDDDIRIFMSDILGSCNNVMAVQPLCEALLRDPEVNVRYQAAVSLGNLGYVEAAECLNKAMQDDEWVQYAVIEALTKIQHSSSVDALVKALGKSSDLVASMIIDALGEMGNVKAVTMLLRRMEDSPTALRNKIVKAVVNILGGKSLKLLSGEERENFREYMLAALKDEDEEIQDAAIQGLAFVGGQKASQGILLLAEELDPDTDQERLKAMVDALASIGLTDAMRNALTGESPNAAAVAVEALGQAADAGSREVLDTLIDSFWNVDLYVQRQIIGVLAVLAGDEQREFLMDVLERHDDGTVIKAAAHCLGVTLRHEPAADGIFALLQHPYDDVKEAALDALIAIASPEVRQRFVELFSSPEPIDRLMATYALGKLGEPENMAQIVDALSDEVPDIRKVAVEALAEVCTDSCGWAPHLKPMLRDENKDVRLAVIEVMGNHCEEEFVGHLIEALGDEDDWVRIRAVDALGAKAISDAVPRLVELLESPNRFVAMKSVEALGNIGGTAAFRALLAASDSDDYELVQAAEDAIARIRESEEAGS